MLRTANGPSPTVTEGPTAWPEITRRAPVPTGDQERRNEMGSRAAKQTASKTGKKKLKLNKETLKDLTAAGKQIKGGARDLSLNQACSIWPVCPGE